MKTMDTTGKKRNQAPPIHNYTRGAKKAALDIAADDEKFYKAFDKYMNETRSSGDTSHFNMKTWKEFHEAWFDGVRRPPQPIIPLTPLRIHVVGTMMKEGGYRSSKNYMDSVTAVHEEAGHPWGPELEQGQQEV